MEEHLDFTVDFETCSLSANAAVMQVAIVPWLRDNVADPFCNESDVEPFVAHIDLRSCVVDGFDFDMETVLWWSRQSAVAKKAVTDGYCEPVSDVVVSMLDYIRGIVKKFNLQSICLWAHGMDVDIAILRNLCQKYDVRLEDTVKHTQFRDCRTIILEAVLKEARKSLEGESASARGTILPSGVLKGSYEAYNVLEPLPARYAGDGAAHDALFDAMRSSWYTWQALKILGL